PLFLSLSNSTVGIDFVSRFSAFRVIFFTLFRTSGAALFNNQVLRSSLVSGASGLAQAFPRAGASLTSPRLLWPAPLIFSIGTL
ncbi:MAG: hypothetical protein RR234_07640, partial [Christensenella sp.]